MAYSPCHEKNNCQGTLKLKNDLIKSIHRRKRGQEISQGKKKRPITPQLLQIMPLKVELKQESQS